MKKMYEGVFLAAKEEKKIMCHLLFSLFNSILFFHIKIKINNTPNYEEIDSKKSIKIWFLINRFIRYSGSLIKRHHIWRAG